jgi:hypothetical protein
MNLLNKYNTWFSVDEIEVPNTTLDLLSRWTDLYACKGKWKIEIQKNDISKPIIRISIPTGQWNGPHTNYWILHSGPFEILRERGINHNKSELSIFQIDKTSLIFNLKEDIDNNLVTLTILNQEIIFEIEK